MSVVSWNWVIPGANVSEPLKGLSTVADNVPEMLTAAPKLTTSLKVVVPEPTVKPDVNPTTVLPSAEIVVVLNVPVTLTALATDNVPDIKTEPVVPSLLSVESEKIVLPAPIFNTVLGVMLPSRACPTTTISLATDMPPDTCIAPLFDAPVELVVSKKDVIPGPMFRVLLL